MKTANTLLQTMVFPLALIFLAYLSSSVHAERDVSPFSERCWRVVTEKIHPPFWNWHTYARKCEEAVPGELAMQCVELATERGWYWPKALEACAAFKTKEQVECLLWKRARAGYREDIDPSLCL